MPGTKRKLDFYDVEKAAKVSAMKVAEDTSIEKELFGSNTSQEPTAEVGTANASVAAAELVTREDAESKENSKATEFEPS